MEKFIPFTKDVMFCEVMKDTEICKELIERIIDRPLKRIIYSNQQETITTGINVRSIRLDACIETVDRTLIDVEMQIGHYDTLPLRFRGYQSIFDSSYWRRGDSFNKLKETYIIFLCTNDPFSKQLPIYSFQPVCEQNYTMDVDFKMHWLALNAQAFKNAPISVKYLLEYMKTNTPSDDSLVQKIDKVVVKTNKDTEKVMQMTTVQDKYNEFQSIINEQDEELSSLKKLANSQSNRLSDVEKLVNALLADKNASNSLPAEYRQQFLEFAKAD
jgi:hypothetical protein